MIQPRVAAAGALPLSKMYSSLLPSTNSWPGLMPPLIHVGWRIDEDRVIDWCQKNDCAVKIPSDDGPIVDFISSSLQGIRVLVKMADAETLHPYIAIPYTTADDSTWMLAFATNHNLLQKRLDAQGILRLRNLLKQAGWTDPDETEKWYLDHEFWEWKRRR